MPWLNSKAPYNSILRYVKEHGVRIYHREIKSGAAGLFDCRQIIITIDKEVKETWDGCYFLAHEWSHYCDYREGKFSKFFETHLNETDWDLIIDAEMSAIKGAVKFLKMWGIFYEPSELTEKGYEEALKFWRKYYFD